MLKMIKKLLKKLIGAVEEKFLKFLECVFSGKTGEFLEENHKIINEVVDQVEEIANIGLDEGIMEIAGKILKNTGFIVSEKIIEDLKNGGIARSEAKRKLATDIIYKKLRELGVKIVIQAVNVGIELAVSKLNK